MEICNFYTVSTTLIEKSFVVYTMKTKIRLNEKLFITDRRFSDFEWLQNYLSNDFNYQVFFSFNKKIF